MSIDLSVWVIDGITQEWNSANPQTGLIGTVHNVQNSITEANIALAHHYGLFAETDDLIGPKVKIELSYEDERYPTLIIYNLWDPVGFSLNLNTGIVTRVCLCHAFCSCECSCGAYHSESCDC